MAGSNADELEQLRDLLARNETHATAGTVSNGTATHGDPSSPYFKALDQRDLEGVAVSATGMPRADWAVLIAQNFPWQQGHHLRITRFFDNAFAPFNQVSWVMDAPSLVAALANPSGTPYIGVLTNLTVAPDLWPPGGIALNRSVVLAGWVNRRTLLDWQGVSGVIKLAEGATITLRQLVLLNAGPAPANAQNPYITLAQWPIARTTPRSVILQYAAVLLPQTELQYLLTLPQVSNYLDNNEASLLTFPLTDSDLPVSEVQGIPAGSPVLRLTSAGFDGVAAQDVHVLQAPPPNSSVALFPSLPTLIRTDYPVPDPQEQPGKAGTPLPLILGLTIPVGLAMVAMLVLGALCWRAHKRYGHWRPWWPHNAGDWLPLTAPPGSSNVPFLSYSRSDTGAQSSTAGGNDDRRRMFVQYDILWMPGDAAARRTSRISEPYPQRSPLSASHEICPVGLPGRSSQPGLFSGRLPNVPDPAASTPPVVESGEEEWDSFDAPQHEERTLINMLEAPSGLQTNLLQQGSGDVAAGLREMVARMQAELGSEEVQVHRVIGKGGGGVVYQGMWRGLTVAVKAVEFQVEASAPMSRAHQRAITEAALCKTLQHPNIVATYAYDLQAANDRSSTLPISAGSSGPPSGAGHTGGALHHRPGPSGPHTPSASTAHHIRYFSTSISSMAPQQSTDATSVQQLPTIESSHGKAFTGSRSGSGNDLPSRRDSTSPSGSGDGGSGGGVEGGGARSVSAGTRGSTPVAGQLLRGTHRQRRASTGQGRNAAGTVGWANSSAPLPVVHSRGTSVRSDDSNTDGVGGAAGSTPGGGSRSASTNRAVDGDADSGGDGNGGSGGGQVGRQVTVEDAERFTPSHSAYSRLTSSGTHRSQPDGVPAAIPTVAIGPGSTGGHSTASSGGVSGGLGLPGTPDGAAGSVRRASISIGSGGLFSAAGLPNMPSLLQGMGRAHKSELELVQYETALSRPSVDTAATAAFHSCASESELLCPPGASSAPLPLVPADHSPLRVPAATAPALGVKGHGMVHGRGSRPRIANAHCSTPPSQYSSRGPGNSIAGNNMPATNATASRGRQSTGVVSTSGPREVMRFRLLIIQEYCDGGTLKAAIDEHRLEDVSHGLPRPVLPHVLQLAADIAAGLAHIHSRRVVHGDLSPNNVLLRTLPSAESGYIAKIADFGLSWKLPSPDKGTDFVSNAHQGTRMYVAPEVFNMGIISKAADVYSFGLLLHEMYHGTPAWRRPGGSHGLTAGALMRTADILPWSSDCPAPYRDLIRACLSPEPNARPPVNRVVEALLSMQRLLGSTALTMPLSVTSTEQHTPPDTCSTVPGDVGSPSPLAGPITPQEQDGGGPVQPVSSSALGASSTSGALGRDSRSATIATPTLTRSRSSGAAPAVTQPHAVSAGRAQTVAMTSHGVSVAVAAAVLPQRRRLFPLDEVYVGKDEQSVRDLWDEQWSAPDSLVPATSQAQPSAQGGPMYPCSPSDLPGNLECGLGPALACRGLTRCHSSPFLTGTSGTYVHATGSVRTHSAHSGDEPGSSESAPPSSPQYHHLPVRPGSLQPNTAPPVSDAPGRRQRYRQLKHLRGKKAPTSGVIQEQDLRAVAGTWWQGPMPQVSPAEAVQSFRKRRHEHRRGSAVARAAIAEAALRRLFHDAARSPTNNTDTPFISPILTQRGGSLSDQSVSGEGTTPPAQHDLQFTLTRARTSPPSAPFTSPEPLPSHMHTLALSTARSWPLRKVHTPPATGPMVAEVVAGGRGMDCPLRNSDGGETGGQTSASRSHTSSEITAVGPRSEPLWRLNALLTSVTGETSAPHAGTRGEGAGAAGAPTPLATLASTVGGSNVVAREARVGSTDRRGTQRSVGSGRRSSDVQEVGGPLRVATSGPRRGRSTRGLAEAVDRVMELMGSGSVKGDSGIVRRMSVG